MVFVGLFAGPGQSRAPTRHPGLGQKHRDFNWTDGPLIGQVADSGETWFGTGGALPQIVAGELVSPAPGATYASLDLGSLCTSMGGAGTFDPLIGRGVITLINGPDNALLDMIHLIWGSTGWTLQIRNTTNGDGLFNARAGAGHTPALATDGTAFPMQMLITGNTVTVMPPSGPVVSYTDPEVGQVSGNVCTWQPSFANGASVGKYLNVWAGSE